MSSITNNEVTSVISDPELASPERSVNENTANIGTLSDATRSLLERRGSDARVSRGYTTFVDRANKQGQNILGQ